MRNCPECGLEMIRKTRLVPYVYKKQTIEVTQPGYWCICGEGILTAEDVKATEKTLSDFRTKIDRYSQ